LRVWVEVGPDRDLPNPPTARRIESGTGCGDVGKRQAVRAPKIVSNVVSNVVWADSAHRPAL